jgi:ribosomal-protein-alanine N-acetyltransferase
MGNAVFKNVFIKTDRLILRNFTHKDKNDFYSITRDQKLYETLPEDHMYSFDEISEIIDWFIYQYDNNTLGNIPKFPLAIILKENNKLIGNVGIGHYSLDKSKMEIFYFVNSNFWNKGYVSEAIDIFLKYIKKNKLVTSLIGTVVPKNIASAKILIKNGFQKIEYNHIIDEYKRDVYELKINLLLE